MPDNVDPPPKNCTYRYLFDPNVKKTKIYKYKKPYN